MGRCVPPQPPAAFPLRVDSDGPCQRDLVLRCHREQTGEDRPLYVFDKRFVDKAPDVEREYSVPGYFAEDRDLFRALGKQRPFFRWVIAGPARSGSTWHIDPNATSAWNAVIRGRKHWLMCPPGNPPPGVHPR